MASCDNFREASPCVQSLADVSGERIAQESEDVKKCRFPCPISAYEDHKIWNIFQVDVLKGLVIANLDGFEFHSKIAVQIQSPASNRS